MEEILLCLIVALPSLAGLLLLFVPGRFTLFWKSALTAVSAAELVLCAWVCYLFMNRTSSLEFMADWLKLSFGSFGWLYVSFHLKCDGLNLSLILLSALVFFVSVLVAFNNNKFQKGYSLLILLLMSSVYGCFLAHDFLLFFIFFEFMLLPMYFLIGIWGGERREYAAIKFFLYTLLGSVFILLVLIATYSSVSDPVATLGLKYADYSQDIKTVLRNEKSSAVVHTLDFDFIFDTRNHLSDSLLHPEVTRKVFGWNVRVVLFFLVLAGFAIKLPVVPLHTWLPDAHVEAPTSVSVILAGILLKIGGYGIIKIVLPLFPDLFKEYATLIAGAGVLSMIYAGLAALAQKDLKKLIAYSSISHMGYVMLGAASANREGLNGAMFQMISHGLISSLLFILSGVIYDRTHNREIANYTGLTQKMPNYAVFASLALFASLGLPVFSGFIAEISVFIGAFAAVKAGVIPLWIVLLSLFTLIIGASYSLWVLQRMFFGSFWIKPSLSGHPLPDLSLREWFMVSSLSFFIVLLGILPSLLFDLLNQF